MAGFWKQLKNALQGNSIARNEARESARRRLRMELLEGRELFAADIQGTVFHDINNDTQLSPGDTPLSGVVVQLFQDNGDGVYGPSDTLKDSATSAGNGGYTLTAESVGNYFVVQNTQPNGFTQRFAQRVQKVTINNSDIAIVDKIVIDTFNTTQQVVNANFPGATPNSSILAAPEALGGERDIFVDATAGTISVSANGTPKPGELVFDVGAGANGKRVVSYDGLDGSASLNSTGLNNLDLTSAGSANAFRFQIGGEAGTRLIIRVYSGANASSREVPIPTTSGANATADLIVPFSDFTSLAGSGANFANVGAIEIEVTGPDAADAIVNTFSTVGPSTRQVNLANLTAMAIGNQVFADRNNNGIWDKTGTNPEVGVPNVQLPKALTSSSSPLRNSPTVILLPATASAPSFPPIQRTMPTQQ